MAVFFRYRSGFLVAASLLLATGTACAVSTTRDQLYATLDTGVEALRAARYEEAVSAFQNILRQYPRAGSVHLLNGVAHHLRNRAAGGSPDMAETGYQVAINQDEGNWLAARQLGYLKLEHRAPEEAARYFAQAAENNPDDWASLVNLAHALYATRNPQQALDLLEQSRLRELDEEHYLAMTALVLSSLDRNTEAEARLQTLRTRYPASALLKETSRASNSWKGYFLRVRDAKGMSKGEPQVPEATESAPLAKEEPAAEKTKPSNSRMVVVDAVILRLDENRYTRSGINLLEALKIEFEGSRSRNLSSGNATQDSKTILQTAISIPKLSYTLYIFNTHGASGQVIAQPSLTVTEGSSAKFFSGTDISVALIGLYNSNLIDKQVGVTLDITPTFLDNNKVMLDVHAARSFLDPGIAEVTTFQQAMRSSINQIKTNVILEMGQTLVLSGLTERHLIHNSDKVDVLGDVPVLGKLFSQKTSEEISTSVVILLTPRYPAPFRGETNAPMVSRMKSLAASRQEMFSPFNVIANIDWNVQRMRDISASHHKQFRDNLLELETWDTPGQLERTIGEAYKEARRELR